MAGTLICLAAKTTYLARGACAGRHGVAGAGEVAACGVGSALAGNLASVSSACGLRGGQLSRTEETERSLYKPSYGQSKS